MSTITREQLHERAREKVKSLEFAVTQTAFADSRAELEEELELARIALASLEAKPIGAFHIADQQVDGTSDYIKDGEWPIDDGVIEAYAATTAPVSVPAAMEMDDDFDSAFEHGKAVGWNAYRAAMLKHSEPFIVTSDHRMMEMPQVEAINAVTAMLQGADKKPDLTVWYGSMPESNGKANWTAILHRKGEGRCMNGFTIDRSEYPGRVLYAADRVRYLIGEKSERPSILDYDADAHSGYMKTGNSPVIPGGQALVPVEPTLEMIKAGANAASSGMLIPGMYRAMLAAAPQQEVTQALAKGMERYGDAMQKLADSGD